MNAVADFGRRPLRVGVVTSIHLDFDGRIWKHATSLAARGCQVVLVSPWAVADGEIRQGVRFVTFPRVQRRFARPVQIPARLLPRLMRLARDVDLLHFHDLDILPWMAVLSRIVPVVYDVHENYPDEMLVRDWIPGLLRRPLYHLVRTGQKALARIVRNVVLVTEDQMPDMPRRANVLYVKNYASRALLDAVHERPSDAPPVVVYTGSHTESNGSGLLPEIFRRSLDAVPELRFLVTTRFASLEARKRFERQLAHFGLVDRVEMATWVAPGEIMSLLNRASIALSPNLDTPNQRRAIPQKLFEFMAAALPIVTSNLPAQQKIVGANGAGILVPAGDVDAYAAAVVGFVRDPEAARLAGRRGRAAFEAYYTWESQMPALMEYYAGIVGGGRAAGASS